MSCHEEKFDMDDCVCDVVRRIIMAQNKVAATTNRCDSSCEQSIKQLLSPVKTNKSKNTTIPFVLYTKDLKPFIANGVFKAPIKGYPDTKYFDVIETPILKAIKFVKGSDCCVKLELLQPVNANGFPVANRGDKLSDFFCDETPFRTINFRETGICITVDLNCFCGITCLDPVKPLPALNMPSCD